MSNHNDALRKYEQEIVDLVTEKHRDQIPALLAAMRHARNAELDEIEQKIADDQMDYDEAYNIHADAEKQMVAAIKRIIEVMRRE